MFLNKYSLILLFFISTYATSSINIDRSRIIINADDKRSSFSLVSSDETPTLIQMWIDNGDPSVSPENIATPIIITRPVFKINPGQVYSTDLLVVSRDNLPKDRESMFFLNIFQIPSTKKTNIANLKKQDITVFLRLRVKAFVRPNGVGPINKEELNKIEFKIERLANDSYLSISNPTPWNVTMLDLKSAKVSILQNLVLEPKSNKKIKLSSDKINADNISFYVLNDFGNQWYFDKQANK